MNPLCRLFVFTVAAVTMATAAAPLGVNYGQIADDLPPPETVLPLLRSLNITMVKLYDSNPSILAAFPSTSGVSITVALPNEHLSLIKNYSTALSWVSTNLKPFLPSTNITSITLGNEVLSSGDPSLISDLLPAMKSLYSALLPLQPHHPISVTTPHSLSILQSSSPPSSGAFRSDLSPHLSPILSFLSSTRSPLLINAYPYFAYQSTHPHVPLSFVLFEKNDGVLDPITNLTYYNMLFAQMDAVHAALAKMGFSGLQVHVSETGWPSKGDEGETGATVENARRYNGNLIKLTKEGGGGTPMRPGCELVVYIFALFNENLKPGPASERNYGLFKPDRSPAYHLVEEGGVTGVPGVAGRGNSSLPAYSPSSSQPSASASSYNGYLHVSSTTTTQKRKHGVVLFSWAVMAWTGVVVF